MGATKRGYTLPQEAKKKGLVQVWVTRRGVGIDRSRDAGRPAAPRPDPYVGNYPIRLLLQVKREDGHRDTSACFTYSPQAGQRNTPVMCLVSSRLI